MAVPVIFGPTAVGKTRLAIELAKQINGEIISADSMQVYRGLDIGTAKPTLEERQGIPHHLIDIRDPDEEWTVSDFVGACPKSQVEIKNNGKTPIIVGGTGLYLWSLLEGFAFPIAPGDKEVREKLEKLPLSDLYSLLSTVDAAAASKIHANDKKRIVRALEVFEVTGKPISELQKLRREEPRQYSLPAGRQVAGSEYILIGLDLPREELYARINARVDTMVAQGLVNEVEGLLGRGYSRELNSFQALGYKEAVAYLDGKWTKEQLAEELQKRTRAFARRQLTWFRRFRDVRWFSPGEKDAIIALCQEPDNRK